MSVAVMREILDLSAKQHSPLDEVAIRQLADAANSDADAVVKAHQERHEYCMRMEARNMVVDVWPWKPYER